MWAAEDATPATSAAAVILARVKAWRPLSPLILAALLLVALFVLWKPQVIMASWSTTGPLLH